MRVDVVIVGNGIAALTASLHLPKYKNILLVTKSTGIGCNSHWAQGGIAAPNSKDDIPLHIADTLNAGDGACDPKAVEVLVNEGYEAIRRLIDLGVNFDGDEKGQILFTKEAAHSTSRILHAGGDSTGQQIHRHLSSLNRHKILTGVTVIDLLIDNGKCYGITVANDNGRFNIYADETIIATGGFGGLYKVSTNAPGMMGELQAIASTRGCDLKDMHFTQFHPTVFTGTPALQKPLLTEALRGEGAVVLDELNRRFLLNIDPRGELAPRDVVSRAIFAHIEAGHEVFLDLQRFDRAWFLNRFPTVSARLIEHGFNPPADPIPISPAFHYAMGGIATDLNAKVTNGLYAVGEVARTGVHGANRLASNSLLEAVVFARLAARSICQDPNHNTKKEFKTRNEPLIGSDDTRALAQIREIMWRDVGVVRSTKGLQNAQQALAEIGELDLGLNVSHSLITAQKVVEEALLCTKSVGAHFLKD